MGAFEQSHLAGLVDTLDVFSCFIRLSSYVSTNIQHQSAENIMGTGPTAFEPAASEELRSLGFANLN